MHIAGVPAGSLGPSLTWGQVWEGEKSAACLACRSSPALGSGLYFWEAAGLAPVGDSPAPATPRMFQALYRGWVVWLGAYPHCTVVAPAQDTRTAVSDGKTQEALYFGWRIGPAEVLETHLYTLQVVARPELDPEGCKL